jgi:hypothetical protein
MWCFFIGPWIYPKKKKTSDTWQPLVLPHHHVNVSMTRVPHTCTDAEVIRTDANVIRTDADVNSTDADSSLADWARLTKL